MRLHRVPDFERHCFIAAASFSTNPTGFMTLGPAPAGHALLLRVEIHPEWRGGSPKGQPLEALARENLYIYIYITYIYIYIYDTCMYVYMYVYIYIYSHFESRPLAVFCPAERVLASKTQWERAAEEELQGLAADLVHRCLHRDPLVDHGHLTKHFPTPSCRARSSRR